MCVAYSFHQGRTQRIPQQVYRLAVEGGKLNPHPNVLPVNEVSETSFPLCIMSPWMPNGNINQYIQKSQGANRLTLVRVHRPEDMRASPIDYARNSLHKRAAA